MDERTRKNAEMPAFNSNNGAGSRTRLERSDNRVLVFEHFCETKMVLEVGLEPTKREAREIYSLLSLPLDDSSNSIIIPKTKQKSSENPRDASCQREF